MHRVSDEEFEKLQKAEIEGKILGHINASPIVGYNPSIKGNFFLSSGGMEISSGEDEIMGSFVIEEDRVIYTPICKFYEERDSFVYSKTDYYAKLTMPEILNQELIGERRFFIDMGEELKGFLSCPVFREVDRDEMMCYALDSHKGKEAYQKRLHCITK